MFSVPRYSCGISFSSEVITDTHGHDNHLFFPVAQQPYSGLGRLIVEVFEITHRHTTLGRTPLDEGPARRRDLYLTTHNTHNRQTAMPPAGFFLIHFCTFKSFRPSCRYVSYYCPYTTNTTQTSSMPPAGFEPTIIKHSFKVTKNSDFKTVFYKNIIHD